jgi:hypothetical protein
MNCLTGDFYCGNHKNNHLLVKSRVSKPLIYERCYTFAVEIKIWN